MDTVFSAAVLGVVIVLVLAEGGPTSTRRPTRPAPTTRRAPSGISSRSSRCSSSFPGSREVIGTFVIPTALLVVMLLLPLLDRVLPAQAGPFPGLRLRLRGRRRAPAI